MTVKQRCITLSRSLAIAVVTVMLAGTALAQTETVLHNFQGNSDGATPMSGLVADKAGNLYGTTHFGGGSNALCGAGCGTVFEWTPPSGTGGHWTYSILYRFGQSSADGVFPQWPLILDAAGNLYGSTLGSATVGSGTVFELSPPAVQGGPWREKILHDFPTPDEAIAESSPLLLDSKGNLYGESQGVLNGLGSIFELSPPPAPGGDWIYKILFAFPVGGLQGAISRGGLIWGANGNLYGVTEKGGGRDLRGRCFPCSGLRTGTAGNAGRSLD